MYLLLHMDVRYQLTIGGDVRIRVDAVHPRHKADPIFRDISKPGDDQPHPASRQTTV